MSTGKRLAKRSILGTRVSAPFDGHFYSGVIQSIKNSGPLDTHGPVFYSVLFDNKINNRKVVLDFKAQDLIGPGFQTIANVALKEGQKVFITYNGREVAGVVDHHNVAADEVFLTVDLSSGSPNAKETHTTIGSNSQIQVRRRLEECRLFESRKSARLLELDTDYSKLAQDGYRGRTSSLSSTVSSSSVTSSNIDVPVAQNGRKRRPSNSEDDVMDDCMAAMVLMSLSCSPKSPRLPELIIYKCTWPGCLYQSEHCQQIEKHVRTQHLGRTDLTDESSDREEEFYYTEIEVDDNSVGSLSSTSSSSHSVPHSPSISNDGSLMSGSHSHSPTPSPQTHIFFAQSCSAPTFSHLEDHEYEKRRQNSSSDFDQKVIQLNNDMNRMNGLSGINVNHNKNGINSNVNNNNLNNNTAITIRAKQKSLLSTPINIPGIAGLPSYRAHTYATSAPPASLHSPRVNHKYMRLNSNNNRVSNGTGGQILGTSIGTAIGTTILQSSPNKTSPSKRGRGESRKCRKVYGMDNRDSWCTQCKWKKACTRFTD